MRWLRACAVSTQSSATQDYRFAPCYVRCPNSSRQRGFREQEESAASKEEACCRKGERQGEGCGCQGRGRQEAGTQEAASQEGRAEEGRAKGRGEETSQGREAEQGRRQDGR